MSSWRPSYISLTAWYSVRPMRRLLEMSYTPPSASVCSPAVPRTYLIGHIKFLLNVPAQKEFAIHYLEVELSGGLFELGKISSQFGQRNVDGSADGGAQVGWAEGQETVFIVVREGDPLLDFVDGVNETGIDGLQVTTFLHGDDAQVIFLVAPNQEGLGVVVVDATSGGPVAAGVGSLKFKIKFNLPNLIDLIETQNVIPEGSDLPP